MKKFVFVIFLLFPFAINAQIVTTFAGGGSGGLGDGGPATAAEISSPEGGVFDQYGNYYCAENLANIVRKVSNTGIITIVAGNGTSGFSGDNGLATAAELYLPNAVKVDTAANIYITDASNYRIRKVNATTGIITTIAGNGTAGFGGDGGPATAAMFNTPNDICFDRSGNMYIADYANCRIRKIDTSSIITTIAGTGTPGYAGDNGPATAAELRDPQGLAIDDTGNLYIAGGNVVRKISPAGIITTVAGVNGMYIYPGDGIQATAAGMYPLKIVIDPLGQLVIADYSNYRVFRVNLAGIIYTIAGNGTEGFSGDNGPATAAEFDYPSGVSFDACGNLYIADITNGRIRKVTYPPILTIPSITLSSIPSSAVGALVTVTATVTNAGSSYNIEWYNHSVLFNTTSVPYVTYTKTAGTDTITARVVSTATYGCYDSTTSAGFIITSEATGIGTLSTSKLYIYPNPANDVLHIDGVGNTSLSTSGEGWGEVYRILNIVGVVMQQSTLKQGSNSIPIQSLPSGMYMVEVTNNKGEKVIKKIIKQ